MTYTSTTSENTTPRRLICCCCGGEAIGRQWRGRYAGFGLCGKCADRIAKRGESEQEMLANYGRPGIHYNVEA